LSPSLLISLAGRLPACCSPHGLSTSEDRNATRGIFAFTADCLDGRVLAFTFALALLQPSHLWLAPALANFRPDLVPALKDEASAAVQGHRRFNLRNVLVVAQVALSLVLLIGAGLFLRSLNHAQTIDPGFAADKIAGLAQHQPPALYQAQGQQFYGQVIERIEALPVGIRHLARVVPMSGGGRTSNYEFKASKRRQRQSQRGTGLPDNAYTVNTNVVALKYFRRWVFAAAGP
jgi:hypothetical protein